MLNSKVKSEVTESHQSSVFLLVQKLLSKQLQSVGRV